MALPKQLRNQIKQGQKIEEHLREEQKKADGENPNVVAQQEIDTLLEEVTPPTEEPKGEEKPKAPVTELHPNKDEGGDPESPPEIKPERTDWKHKYSVLKGKYDVEVPRLSQDLREYKDRVTALEDKITGLAAAPAPQEELPRTDFTTEEIADYGEDLLDVIGRKARGIVEQEYAPKMGELEQQVDSLQKQLGETGQRVAKAEENEVFTQLDREVENWREINVDPEFHAWLDQIDPFSGVSRKDLMLQAFARKNAHQVKAFFETYKQENAAVISPSTAASPSGQGGEDAATLNLENYVAPGTPRTGGQADAPRAKREWTRADISKFFSDVQKGHYKSRPDDKARIEADIVAASREGRIK